MTSNVQNNFVQAYLEANKALIRTLVVKSKFGAYAINEKLIKKYGEGAVDKYDPTSWKYYKNIAGEYHETDSPMEVISLDTRDTILFNKENLRLHTATKEAYKNGTRFYLALVRQFPEQEFLINCIQNPCPIQKAIDAPEGAILSYQPDLVEEFETTLMVDLGNFIDRFNSRWNVEAFSLTDPYYAYMQRVVMGQLLLLEVLNLRLARCKTDEVHSFHLRAYLASHHKLDRWLPYLTREQALWVYRNIKFIERNAGRVEIFDALLENLLDKRYIPVVEYSVRQLSEFFETGFPVLMARRKQISKTPPATQTNLIEVHDYYKNESATTYGNPSFMEIHEEKVTHLLGTSPSSVIQTKDLESSMIDLSNSMPDPLPEVLLRQWVSMTHMGLYNVVVNFQDVKTGREHSLVSWDAVVYMLYLACKAEKIPFTKIPLAANIKFRRHPRPDVTELTKFIEPNMGWLRSIAEELVRNQPVLSVCYSTSMFYEMSYQVYEECQKHWKMLAATHDLYTRGVLEQMILKLFGSSLRDFSRGEDVEVWRARMNLPVYDYTWSESEELQKEIFERATGYRIDTTKQLKHIQHALISMFEELSSYSIQFLREINDDPIILAGGNGLRFGMIEEEGSDQAYIRTGIHFLKDDSYVEDEIQEGMNLETGVIAVNEIPEDYIQMELNIGLDMWSETVEENTVPILPIYYRVQIETVDPVTNQTYLIDEPPLDQLLTQEQMANLLYSENNE